MSCQNKKDYFWKTYDGRELQENEITHQHASNIFHYSRIHRIASQYLSNHYLAEVYKHQHALALRLINSKFNGEILPYFPMLDPERILLEKMGMIEEKTGNIYLHGKIIGNAGSGPN